MYGFTALQLTTQLYAVVKNGYSVEGQRKMGGPCAGGWDRLVESRDLPLSAFTLRGPSAQ